MGHSRSSWCCSSSRPSLFYVLLHRTSFGRTVYAIGNNPVAAQFSGIRVERVKFILFLLTGLMAGLAAVCLTSRLGSTRPSIATGVGAGGRHHGGARRRQHLSAAPARIGGVVLAALIMGMVTFGFGLLNVPGIVMSIFIGLLLILVIAVPMADWQVAHRQGALRRLARHDGGPFRKIAVIDIGKTNAKVAVVRSGRAA